MIKIESYIDERTFRRFKIFHVFRLYKAWKSPVIFASILCVSAIICFIKRATDGALFLGSILVLIGLTLPVVWFSTFFASLRKECKRWNLNPPRLVYTFELDDSDAGIHVANEKQRAVYRWDIAGKAYLDEGCIYLFMTADQAFLLPYKEEQREELWGLFRARMGEKALDVRKRADSRR